MRVALNACSCVDRVIVAFTLNPRRPYIQQKSPQDPAQKYGLTLEPWKAAPACCSLTGCSLVVWYVNEFVEHYEALGVTKIHLYIPHRSMVDAVFHKG